MTDDEITNLSKSALGSSALGKSALGQSTRKVSTKSCKGQELTTVSSSSSYECYRQRRRDGNAYQNDKVRKGRVGAYISNSVRSY